MAWWACVSGGSGGVELHVACVIVECEDQTVNHEKGTMEIK